MAFNKASETVQQGNKYPNYRCLLYTFKKADLSLRKVSKICAKFELLGGEEVPKSSQKDPLPLYLYQVDLHNKLCQLLGIN